MYITKHCLVIQEYMIQLYARMPNYSVIVKDVDICVALTLKLELFERSDYFMNLQVARFGL